MAGAAEAAVGEPTRSATRTSALARIRTAKSERERERERGAWRERMRGSFGSARSVAAHRARGEDGSHPLRASPSRFYGYRTNPARRLWRPRQKTLPGDRDRIKFGNRSLLARIRAIRRSPGPRPARPPRTGLRPGPAPSSSPTGRRPRAAPRSYRPARQRYPSKT